MSPIVVVVAGGSASGKSTVCAALAAQPGVRIIAHDRYYKDAADPATHNFDEPDALETSLLVAHLAALRAGEAVDAPVYSFPLHARTAETERLLPAPILLVEGILSLASPALVAAADLRIFVDCPADVRLARRVLRDVAERGRGAAQVVHRYLHTVRPMHARWVEPSRATADLVLDGEAPPAVLAAAAWEAISRRVAASGGQG
jgi:uridine kinase